jgi:hypothetical protein
VDMPMIWATKLKRSPVAIDWFWKGSRRRSEEEEMASSYALMKAAQAWCQPATSSKEMDSELAEAFAEIMDAELADLRARVKALEYELHYLPPVRLDVAEENARLSARVKELEEQARQSICCEGEGSNA